MSQPDSNTDRGVAAVTWNEALWVVEGVVHEHSAGGCRGAAQAVVDYEGVVAVVEVGGLVEGQAAVGLGAVALVSDHLGEDVHGLLQLGAIVEPADVGGGVPINREGEAPVMLRHGVAQLQDLRGD